MAPRGAGAADVELDPIEIGLLKSPAHPGGNATGVFLDLPEFSTALLELLKQAMPSLASIVVLWDPATYTAQRKAVVAAAQRLKITTEVRTPDEFDAAFEAATARRPDGLLMLSAPLLSTYSKRLAELTLKHRLPAVSMFSSFARAGGLMSYGSNLDDLYRKVGVITGKILKGTMPADLPVERPARFEMVVNLKLARADEVIEAMSHIGMRLQARRRRDGCPMPVQAYLGHSHIQNIARYTALASGRCKNLWRD
jgi:putative tryptophan/tyrosine transport system substrate-binding protein